MSELLVKIPPPLLYIGGVGGWFEVQFFPARLEFGMVADRHGRIAIVRKSHPITVNLDQYHNNFSTLKLGLAYYCMTLLEVLPELPTRIQSMAGSIALGLPARTRSTPRRSKPGYPRSGGGVAGCGPGGGCCSSPCLIAISGRKG